MSCVPTIVFQEVGANHIFQVMGHDNWTGPDPYGDRMGYNPKDY